MARLITDGFEMGDFKSWTGVVSSPAIGTSKRSGTYGATINSTDKVYLDINDTSEVYIRVCYYIRHQYNSPYISAYDTTSGNVLRVETTSLESGVIGLYVGGSLVTSFAQSADNTWNLFEIHFKVHATEGAITVKKNGVEVASYTGATNTVNDTFNRIYIGDDSGRTDAYYMDDIAINDTSGTEDNSWCGDGHIILYKPNASGSTTMLMGNDENQTDNYALVDDIPSDGDTTYVYSGSPGYYDLYKLEDTALPVNSVIKRVWVESRAKDPDMGYLKSVIQTASGSYTSGSVQLTTAYDAQVYDEYTTNPDTGIAWTSDEIDYLQAGIQIAE